MAVCTGDTSKMVKSQGTGGLSQEMTRILGMNTKAGGSMDSFKEKGSSYGRTGSNMSGNGR